MSRSFYVTTAIDYPNGAPHLGHLYEKIVADTYARWYRQCGLEVYFLTGTDENGQKLMKSAEAAGLPTQAFVDQNTALFRKMCADLQLTNDDFIRTTEPRHIATTQRLWQTLESKGDIYFGRYAGNYCISCETFYPDNQVVDNRCPEHGIKLEFMEADGYFFRMSKYQNWIVQQIRDHSKFLFPASARKEILSRLEGEELRDLSISRPNQGWGIPVPGNDKHVIYTWFDALINYYAGVMDQAEHHKFWPASMHIIGKDITWFHSVIWPVMLHAAEVSIPEQIYVHGMLLASDGKKMSKSLGNVVSPYELIGHVSNDLIRYFMIRAVASGQDGAFSVQDLIARHNNELANDLGNLIMRVVKLTLKRVGPEIGPEQAQQELRFDSMRERMVDAMDAREHHRALDILWEGINQINGYLNQFEPWRIKDNPARFHECMYNALFGLGCVAVMAKSFIPETSSKLAEVIGFSFGGIQLPAWGVGFRLTEPQSLFPKIELNSEGKIAVQAARGP